MTDEPEAANPTPAVKKVVVKKTVVRKPSDQARSTTGAVARPTSPRSPAAARAAAQAAARQRVPAPEPKVHAPEPSRRRRWSRGGDPAVPRDGANADDVEPPRAKRSPLAGLGRLFAAIGGVFGALWWRIRDFCQAVVDHLILFEWPRPGPVAASVITGAVTGVIAAGAGYGIMQVFATVLGTPSGGGRYGTLALLGIGLVVFVIGRWLAGRQAVRHPGMTTFLGLTLTLIAVLVFFLDLSRTVWGWALLPALMAACFAAAQALLVAAEGEIGDRVP